jgi:hypothetical protein
MTLETAFRRWGLLPGFTHGTASLVQTGNGEPRKAHWLGNKQPGTPAQDQKQGGGHDPSSKRPDPRGYRPLASLTLGEVEEAYLYFKSQLVPSPLEGWVAKNYFCQLPLRRGIDERPPVLFGRVNSIYPSDGHLHNVEEIEMHFPHSDAPPDLLHIREQDLDRNRPAQSYCVGVKFYLSQGEIDDFSQSENIFLEKGFAPLYEKGYLDLLDVREENHAALPWLHVVGSEWFASIPDSIQAEIREQLRNLVRWGSVVFNYHPRRHALHYLSLNEELDFNYGFSEHYLLTPQNTDQVLKKLDESFSEIFMGITG